MNDSSFIRARSPEHKAQRSAEILRAATHVLDRDGIDAVTLAAIAKEAGVVKSNLYRYFESREEILFRLMIIETAALTETGLKNLEALKRRGDIAAIAQTFATDCAQNPRFCLLISHMAPILEHNISVQQLIEMKKEAVGLLLQTASALHRALPALGEAGSIEAVHMIIHHIAGLWPMANPPAPVEEALQHPDLAFLKQDYLQSMIAATEVILEGICARNARD